MTTIQSHSASPPIRRAAAVVRRFAGEQQGDMDEEEWLARLAPVPLDQPERLRLAVADLIPSGSVLVAGTQDRRLLLLAPPRPGPWWAADLSGQPHATRAWPAWARRHLHWHDPSDWLSRVEVDAEAEQRLTRPRVLLVALYKPEVFPLPRFSLSISDLARACRSTLCGQVRLLDMQLGATAQDVMAAVTASEWRPDILGLSATFGQHDLLESVLDEVYSFPDPPLILAGGSLTVRNEALLLQRYPRLLIARGAGEPTVADILGWWHKDLSLDEVRGIGHAHSSRGGALGITRRRTATATNRAVTDTLPELDLLDATLAAGGVAQLETSRGCTSACSFCPRGHKGSWSGAVPEHLPWMLRRMAEVFDRYPDTARVLYLVDEEFIGAGPDPVGRALNLASTLHEAGFAWETSCRVDQVTRPDADRDWHRERARMWRALVDQGLRRCLFGVESGVTSVLDRFSKDTVADQNVLAARTLSALGVATRFTYITFDPLMTLDELRATYAFQARTDLLLRPLPHQDVETIVDGVREPEFVAAHTVGQPFYTEIPYMLVSMECLTGSAYTRRVQQASLAGAAEPAMGRVHAAYLDWRIGVASRHAQLWIDRNFTLDYTLKSLEKTLAGPPRHAVRGARGVIKDAAFAVLGDMLACIDAHTIDEPHEQDLAGHLRAVMDARHSELRLRLADTVGGLARTLPTGSAMTLKAEHSRWRTNQGWQLINAASCHT